MVPGTSVGVVTITFDTGEVLDFECFYTFFTGCVQKQMQKIRKTYTITQELQAMLRRKTWFALHTQYLGDCNSKGFATVLDTKPSGEDIKIINLECVDHNLKNNINKIKLDDGKGIGGKDRLTDAEIDKL